MKRIQIISLALLTGVSQHAAAINMKVPDWAKKPSMVSTIVGNAPKSYSVVVTKITKDPNDQDGKPVIVRTSQGNPKPAGSGDKIINKVLTIPQSDIVLSAGKLPEAAASVAGLIDPRAGAAAKGASALFDEALNIAGQALTEKYGLNAFEINLIELLPTQYYYTDDGDNKVKTKEAFLPALQQYTELLKKYTTIAEPYNRAVMKYNTLRNLVPEQEPPNIPKFKKQYDDYQNKYNAAMNVWENELRPLEQQKLDLESKLTTMAIHRITIMASQDDPSKGSGCSGDWKGPWSLYLYYFIGSKQTNKIKIDFCAHRDIQQAFNIRLNGNDQRDGNFIAGGVNLEATSNKTIKFPRTSQDSDTSETEIYSWFDEMVTNEHGDDIATYMYPYDLFALEQKRLKEKNDKNDKRSQENIDKFNEAMTELKGALGDKGKGGLLDLIKGGGSSKEPNDTNTEEPNDEENNITPTPKDKGTTPPTGKGKNTPTKLSGEEDYYTLLDVDAKASTADITEAYNKAKEAAKGNRKELEKIESAYLVLSTPALRKTYDAGRQVQNVAKGGLKVVNAVKSIYDLFKGDDKTADTPIKLDSSGKTPSGNTYYEILDVAPNATTNEIDDAYENKKNSILKAYKGGGDKQKIMAKAKELDQAYAILSDEEKRKDYNWEYGFDEESKTNATTKK